MSSVAEHDSLPEPSDAVSIFVLGLLGFVSFGVLGIFAWYLGRAYKVKLARGLVRRSGLADAGFVMGTIGFIIFLAFVALLLLVFTGVVVLGDLLFSSLACFHQAPLF